MFQSARLHMSDSHFYDSTQRSLQDEFQSRALADRLEKLIVKTELTPDDIGFVQRQDHVFLSTVDEAGFPTVSHKGGDSGFIKAISNTQLLLPCFDGNGMWMSAGNAASRGKVGLLFIDFESPQRLRIQGTASLVRDSELLAHWPEVALAIQIDITAAWMNCPRYIHKMQSVEKPIHVPREGVDTPEADWKSLDIIKDVVPPKPHQV